MKKATKGDPRKNSGKGSLALCLACGDGQWREPKNVPRHEKSLKHCNAVRRSLNPRRFAGLAGQIPEQTEPPVDATLTLRGFMGKDSLPMIPHEAQEYLDEDLSDGSWLPLTEDIAHDTRPMRIDLDYAHTIESASTNWLTNGPVIESLSYSDDEEPCEDIYDQEEFVRSIEPEDMHTGYEEDELHYNCSFRDSPLTAFY